MFSEAIRKFFPESQAGYIIKNHKLPPKYQCSELINDSGSWEYNEATKHFTAHFK